MILVMSGTSDGRIISEKLSKKFKVISSVTTDYGEKLLKDRGVSVHKGKMNSEDIMNFINVNKVKLVIDATHPYAKEVSQNTITACKKLNTEYIRYERPKDFTLSEDYFYSYEDALEELKETKGNILLTVGSNNLYRFMSEDLRQRIYARILPTSSVLEMCEKLKISPDKIIAMKGPFTKEMNKLIIKEFDIKTLVTKESSIAGGFPQKVESALESKINLIVINRPVVEYPNEINDINELLELVCSRNS
ncbi:precorrin-6A reductase [Helicovermis profundi]|uniref:Precorrin-6A reductase n=1 Tax=Helicovermis profundi TaxID=3065157 RepID=A0AAU9EF73_9FIRM|nr:precorrin-6A reductase [Clostridia bacterium S502]